MTKSNRLPKQNHHRSRPQRRDNNNYINSRHFLQASNQEPASESNESSEYDTCSGYESAPEYDSSLENSSDYDPFFGCSSSSGAPSSFGSRAASPDSESPNEVRKERIAQNQGSGATSNAAADAKGSQSNGSTSVASKPSTASFAPVGAGAFSSSRFLDK